VLAEHDYGLRPAGLDRALEPLTVDREVGLVRLRCHVPMIAVVSPPAPVISPQSEAVSFCACDPDRARVTARQGPED
jgi:hypothetical protein